MNEVEKIVELLKEKFVEMNDVQLLALLMELQQEIFSFRQFNIEKVSDILANQTKEKITFKEGCYYQGGIGPNCPSCWEKEDKLVLMEVVPRKIRKNGSLECSECHTILINRS